MTTARSRLNAACRALGNPAEANVDTKIGDMLENLRAAIVAICTNIDADSGTTGTDYVANAVTAFGLADDGNFDLNEN